MNEAAFTLHPLNDRHQFWSGQLPADLLPSDRGFETLWKLHPEDYHVIQMPGGPVKTPRWQQAYGPDHRYTGRTNRGLPMPAELLPLLDWCNQEIDQRHNAILLNWYDGQQGHYIGRHRDYVKDMVEGSPIVTISFGEERIFRLRPWRAEGRRDFPARNGTVFVMPFATNLAWTHEVPGSKKQHGRRISVTIRAFAGD